MTLSYLKLSLIVSKTKMQMLQGTNPDYSFANKILSQSIV